MTAAKKNTRKSSGRMASKGFPNPVDVFIGDRVRQRRLELGMSQEVLANQLLLTFQQVQKYEKGSNRVSASRMVDCARALGVEPSWFFEGIPAHVLNASPAQLNRSAPPLYTPDKGLSRYDLETLRRYHGLELNLRQIVGHLVRSLDTQFGKKTDEGKNGRKKRAGKNRHDVNATAP